jgi:hypothetical protein
VFQNRYCASAQTVRQHVKEGKASNNIKISMDEIVIKLSKTKIVALTLGSIAFIAGGLWLWIIADTQTRFNPFLVKGFSIAAVLFFGMCGLYGLTKLFDNKPGLIINNIGLLDNSSGVSGHLIKWTDITGLDVEQVQQTRFLLIFVNNPNDFLNKANRFKRFWMKMNHKMYGTPLSISSTSLQCNFDELVSLIKDGLKKRVS